MRNTMQMKRDLERIARWAPSECSRVDAHEDPVRLLT